MSHPKIISIDTVLIDLPTVRPHVLSMAAIDAQTMVLVTVQCSDEIEGHGEGTTIAGLSYGEESPEGIKLAIDAYFAPLLIGQRADQVGALMAQLHQAIVGNRFAKNAIETALLDCQGKRLGIPVSELLGGKVQDRLPVVWTLASGDAQTDVDEAMALIEAGRHEAFKVKIGRRSLKDDIAHMRSLRDGLGDDVSLRVDVNQRWSESTARSGLAQLADLQVDLVEQPVSRYNRGALARLRARSPLSLMADEAIHGPEDIFDLCAQAAADIYSIKIAQCGGLTRARAAADIATASGASLYGGTMLESGLGTAASAHVFAAIANFPYGTELFGPLLLRDDVLTEPLLYENSELTVPSGPGLGVSPDPDRVAFFRRDKTTTLIASPSIEED